GRAPLPPGRTRPSWVRFPPRTGGGRCAPCRIPTTSTALELTSKRDGGFPSESRVERGRRIVHGDKELEEKLGRNDPCPCGSSRRFQELLHAAGGLRRPTAGHFFQRVAA